MPSGNVFVKVATPGPGYLATSASSVAIGTGSKTFATQAGLAYAAGMRVRVANDSSHYMEGPVSSYSGTSLVVTVDRIVGAGTFTVWTIGLAGDVGATGATGAAGPPGVAYTARGAYAGGTTYAQGDMVTSVNIAYISLQSTNIGHTPASNPTWWQALFAIGDLAWTNIDGVGGNPALQNGWLLAFAPPRFMKDGAGVVHCSGSIYNGTMPSAATPITIFTLPVGYRPTSNIYFELLCASNVTVPWTLSSAAIQIVAVSGAVQLVVCGSNTGLVSLEDIAFQTL